MQRKKLALNMTTSLRKNTLQKGNQQIAKWFLDDWRQEIQFVGEE